jgi:hypothetical protein
MPLVRVNATVTEFVPSLATISCETGSPTGASTVPTKAPELSVVIDAGDVARVIPSHFTVMRLDAAYPYPVRVIVVPTTPLVGALVRDDVTVNVVGMLLTPSVARMLWTPAVLEGTPKITLKPPVAEVVAFPTCDPS